jgi:ribosomal protein S6
MERHYKLDDSVLRTLTVLVSKVVLNQEQKKKPEPKIETPEKKVESQSAIPEKPEEKETEEKTTIESDEKSEESEKDEDTLDKHDE